jgi:hypothetical protein
MTTCVAYASDAMRAGQDSKVQRQCTNVAERNVT